MKAYGELFKQFGELSIKRVLIHQENE